MIIDNLNDVRAKWSAISDQVMGGISEVNFYEIEENGEKFYKKDIYKLLIIVLALSLLASFLGFSNDDPMISTVAAVYIPFPLVALVFPAAIRHLQRSRSYVVFIPAMFLSMRFPWFLFLLVPLFVLSRHYFYFTSGKIYPTFKVDTPEEVSS